MHIINLLPRHRERSRTVSASIVLNTSKLESEFMTKTSNHPKKTLVTPKNLPPHHPAARRARRKRAEEASLENVICNIIYPMLTNSNHIDFISSWEDEALSLYMRLVRSARLRELHEKGLFDEARYFILKGVKNSRLNCQRAEQTLKKSNTCSLNELEESFDPNLIRALLNAHAANNDDQVFTLEYIHALAQSEERMRFELNVPVEIFSVLLAATPENRFIFIAKVFTDLTSRQIGDWVHQCDYIVNNRYHKMISEVRRRVHARLKGRCAK